MQKNVKPVASLVPMLENQRQKANEKFEGVFTNADKMAKLLDVKEEKLKIGGSQAKQKYHDVRNCQNLFRVCSYIPKLDNVKEDLKTRFGSQLISLLPEIESGLNSKEKSTLVYLFD